MLVLERWTDSASSLPVGSSNDSSLKAGSLTPSPSVQQTYSKLTTSMTLVIAVMVPGH